MSEQQAFGFADGYSSEYCDNAVSVDQYINGGYVNLAKNQFSSSEGMAKQLDTNRRLDPKDPVFGTVDNKTGIDVCGYKILVEMAVPAEIQRSIDAGIKVPDTILSRYTTHGMVAKIIQVGRGCYRPERYPEGPWCKPGDLIAMAPYSGTRIYSKVFDREYRLINEDTVDAIVISADVVEASHS